MRSLAVISSMCIILVVYHPSRRHPLGAAAEARQPRPTSDPTTSMDERVDTVPCSAKELHRKSRSAATSQPSMRAVSHPFTFGILERTTLPVSTPSREKFAVMEVSGAKAGRRRSLGTCFCSLNHGTGETSWGVDRARGVRGTDNDQWNIG